MSLYYILDLQIIQRESYLFWLSLKRTTVFQKGIFVFYVSCTLLCKKMLFTPEW